MKTIDQFLAHLSSLEVRLWLEDNDRLRCSAPEAVLTDDLSRELQARKAEITAFLRQTASIHQPQLPLKPVPRDGKLPLSFAQQRLWFLEQLHSGATYHIPIAVRLTGTLDINAFERALNTLIERHESLRTNIQVIDGEPVQVIAPATSRSLPVVDLQFVADADRDAAIKQYAIPAAQTPFNLAEDNLLRVKLLRLSASEHILLLTLHHIITDGWSMEVLLREWVTLYAAFSSGQPSPLPDLPIQYADFAMWQRQWLQGEVLDRQLAYWKQQLQDLPVLQLPTDLPRSRVQTFRGAVEQFSLPLPLTQAVQRLSQSAGTTLFMTLLAAFKVLLYRYTGQADVVVGSPIANRTHRETEGLIGFFVNTLVLRTDLSGNPSFRTLLQRVQQTTWAAYDHQDLPFEKLVAELHPERDLSYSPLFQVKFRLETPPSDTLTIPGLTLTALTPTQPSAKLDLSLDLYETSSGLVGGLEYNRDLFTADTLRRLANHFCTLVASIVTDPDQPIGSLTLLTPTEQQQFVAWNQTAAPYNPLCFHHLFEAQAAQRPDTIALIYVTSEGVQHLTYGELNRRSNQLAHHLQSLGVGPETLVGIGIDRSLEMIIALLAVLKAGGAYLPLDPAYPPERLSYMLQDSQTQFLITCSTGLPLCSSLPTSHSLHHLDLATWNPTSYPTHNPDVSLSPDHLAYLIYTSGSTGQPKGVLVPHAGLANLTADKIRACRVTPDSCILQFFSLSFDASIPEIIMALGSGAKLCLAPRSTLLPGPDLLHLLCQQAITHITLTPSALAAVPEAPLPALEMVLVGGEAPSPDLIRRWCENRLFINAYGPTEVTVNASMVPCGNGYPLQPTIRPSANKQLYVLDEHLQPLPIGAIGELHIGGIGLARGYLNRPALTAEKFIPDPFSAHPASRLYKTGDLATYLPDGRIKLLGRIDSQVKIRGFRIEPGEIETLLTQHPQVQAAIVTLQTLVSPSPHSHSEKRLIAYILPTSDSSTLSPLIPQTLRTYLKNHLPDYMLPAAFVLLDRLPLTPNGKIDYASLPAPNWSQRSQPLIAPRTPIEDQLVALFAKLLDIKTVSLDDDFFELGGHSLLATRLIAQALQTFEVELTVADLFTASTPRELAERITYLQTQRRLQSPAADDAAEREEIEL
ncbi:MAG: amino acid adenylation domain-containing protein [Synechococcales cyanobacterium M58_A2018_015]|nr:amino acid adenylation domain-containing protein [Synechococcales cyanobacterium M58_A2018_015]